jgi:hypothetical protein
MGKTHFWQWLWDDDFFAHPLLQIFLFRNCALKKSVMTM